MTSGTPWPCARCSDWYRDGVDVAGPGCRVLSTYLGHVEPSSHLLVPVGRAGTARPGRRAARDRLGAGHDGSSPPPCRRSSPSGCIDQRHASAHTVAAYRDTCGCCCASPATAPASRPASWTSTISTPRSSPAFLDHLETRTRQQRAHPQRPAGRDPTRCSATPPCAIPNTPRSSPACSPSPPNASTAPSCHYLDPHEVDALLAAPDRSTWTGRRDHALLDARRPDRSARLRADRAAQRRRRPRRRRARQLPRQGTQAAVHPAAQQTVAVLAVWLNERGGGPDDPLFPTSRGSRISRDAVRTPRRQTRPTPPPQHCPSLARQAHHAARPAAHLRHAPARARRRHHRHRTLARPRAGRNHPDLPPRRHVASRNARSPAPRHPATTPGRYRPTDTLLAFLDGL